MNKMDSELNKKFLASKDKLNEVQDFIFESIKSDKLSLKDKNQLCIVIEEIFINIASYSYKDYGYVDVGVNFKNNTLTLIFIDNGKKFNPLKKDDPNVKAKAEERDIGGLGIFMVKNIMDEVYYDYKDNKNILTLVKKY